jgi:hypothetical protein
VLGLFCGEDVFDLYQLGGNYLNLSLSDPVNQEYIYGVAVM